MTGDYSRHDMGRGARLLEDMHPNQIQDWRGRSVGSAERLFERGAARDNDTEHQLKELHAKIGQLTMEQDFLSGKLGH